MSPFTQSGARAKPGDKRKPPKYNPPKSHGWRVSPYKTSKPGKGELYQLSVASAERTRPAYTGMDDLGPCSMGDDLLASFGEPVVRGDPVDWSGYRGNDD